MANSKVSSIVDGISKKVSSSGSSGSGSVTSATGRDDLFAARYSSKDTLLFKSFDFSNVAIYGGGSNYSNTDDSDFRRFHQMTMYIQVPSVYSHGSRTSLGGQTMVITSNLPESISYSVSSEWTAPLNFGNATTNLLMQMAGNQLSSDLGSGVSRATTMRIWNSTKPLSLQLKIPVIDDNETSSGTNLVEALEVLGSLALPTVGGLGFYNPPPSPLRMSIKYATHLDDAGNPVASSKPWNFSTNNPSRIMIQLGGMLLVDYCVIEGFDVSYPNTKTMIKHDYAGVEGVDFGKTGKSYLHPLLAEVNLKVSTIEALTANTYSKMLWAKTQDNQGGGTFDVSKGVLGYLSAGVVSTSRIVKKAAGALTGS